jgi:hypothetical protein
VSKPPGKLKNKLNSLKIDDEERIDLFGILQSKDYCNAPNLSLQIRKQKPPVST